MIETINVKLCYRSQNSNGWPLIMVSINEHVVDRFQADQSEWQGQIEVDLRQVNVLKIEHYGKNYQTDSDPDKYFELQKCFLNQVNLKHHIYRFRQTAYLAPWDTEPPPEHSLYLGHNGYLVLEFGAPLNDWIRSLFGVHAETMHGQITSREVLADIKKFFDL